MAGEQNVKPVNDDLDESQLVDIKQFTHRRDEQGAGAKKEPVVSLSNVNEGADSKKEPTFALSDSIEEKQAKDVGSDEVNVVVVNGEAVSFKLVEKKETSKSIIEKSLFLNETIAKLEALSVEYEDALKAFVNKIRMIPLGREKRSEIAQYEKEYALVLKNLYTHYIKLSAANTGEEYKDERARRNQACYNDFIRACDEEGILDIEHRYDVRTEECLEQVLDSIRVVSPIHEPHRYNVLVTICMGVLSMDGGRNLNYNVVNSKVLDLLEHSKLHK